MKSTVNICAHTHTYLLPFATLIRLIRFYLSLFLSRAVFLLILLCRVPVNADAILHILSMNRQTLLEAFICLRPFCVLFGFYFDSFLIALFRCVFTLFICDFDVCANLDVNGTLFSGVKRRTAPIASKIRKIMDLVCVRALHARMYLSHSLCVCVFF